MLTNNIPAIINEYNSMLRPLKIGEPDSLWNLLSIVRDMYRKNDRNALPLLEIITDEMTNCVQVSYPFSMGLPCILEVVFPDIEEREGGTLQIFESYKVSLPFPLFIE